MCRKGCGFLSLVGSEIEGEGGYSLLRALMSQIFILAWQVFVLLLWLGTPLLSLGGSFYGVSSSPLACASFFHGRLFCLC